MRRSPLAVLGATLLFTLLIAACSPAAAPSPTAAPAPAQAPKAAPTSAPAPAAQPAATQPAAAPEKRTFPDTINGSTSALTSAVTIVFAGVEPEFEKILGTKLRFVNADLIMSQAVAIQTKKAQFWNTHLGSAIRAIYGMEEFASEDWGPQRIRMAWRGGPLYLAMLARESSGMKTVADLKGKKVATYPGGEGFISACLASAGLTLNDVTVVPTSAYNDGLRAVLENRADSAFGDPGSTVAQEIASSPGGLVYLSMPHDNKEGWAALQKVNPSLLPMTPPEGWGGTKEAWGVEMLGFPYAEFAYDYVDQNITYGIAKVLAEGYPAYKDKHAQLQYWTLDTALDVLDLPVPLHDGTIAYFKETGKWTSEMQSWQDRQLDRENQRMGAWPKALDEAKTKGIAVDIKNQDWQKLWKGYLDNIK